MSKKTDNSGLSKTEGYSRDVLKYDSKSNNTTWVKAKSLKYSTRKAFSSSDDKVNVSVHIKKEARQGKFSKINEK